MQRDQFGAVGGQGAEESHVGRQRQAREVDLEELGVARAIRRRMKHRVGVVEDVFRADALAQVAMPLRQEPQTERRRDGIDESGGEVGGAAVVARGEVKGQVAAGIKVKRKVETAAAIEEVVVANLPRAVDQIPRTAGDESRAPTQSARFGCSRCRITSVLGQSTMQS